MKKNKSKKTRNTSTDVIRGIDVIKHSGGFMPPSFRTGGHMTEKDRPRKKIKPHNYDEQKY